jgi:transcription elongation factor Elf1
MSEERPKPCPFCGSDDVEATIEAACSDMVRCYNCGAKIALHWPDEWPKDFEDEDYGEEWERSLRAWNVKRCLTKWNRRAN